MKLSAAVVIIIAVLAVLVGCPSAEKPVAYINVDTGFTPQASIMPGDGEGGEFSLTCTEFRIVSAVGDPSSIDQVFGLGGGEIPVVNAGLYHLTTYARNAAHQNLGSHYDELQVEYGQIATLHVVVAEFTEDGTATGTLTWEPDILPTGLPTFNITMTKTSTSAVYPMPFTLNESNQTGVGGPLTLPPGWYTAVGVLADVYGHASTGFAAAVRIAANHNTLMALALHAIPTTGGSGFTFEWTGTPELQITGTPAPGDVAVYHSTTVPMLITSPEAGFTVAWYLNGVQVGTGAAWDLDPSLMPVDNTYRLDAVAVSADLQRASSITWTVTKGLYAPAEVRISGTVYMNNWTSSQHAVVSLRTVAAPDVIIGSVTIPGGAGSPYSFENVAPGEYCIFAQVVEYPGSSTWWNAGNLDRDGAVPADGHVIIPQSGSATFNFPQGLQ